MEWLTTNWKTIVALVGAAVIFARILCRLLPGDSDSAFVERVVAFLKVIGLYIPPTQDEVAKKQFPGDRRPL